MRQQLSLDGTWPFQLDPQNKLTLKSLKPNQKVTVPAPWQAHEGLRDYSGVAWYQRSFKLSAKMLGDGQAIVLRFGAADYLADVWVNGKKIGMHEGGYLPFEFDITKAVKVGANGVTVRVDDRLVHFAEAPHGKQSWYGPISGLWQSVSIESRPKKHLLSVKVSPHGEQADVTVMMNVQRSKNDTLRYEVIDPDGKLCASLEAQSSTVSVHVPSPKLWDVDTPILYTIRVTLNDADTIEDTFGFRTIETREGKLWLNGRPIYMRSALDQDYYPDGIYTPPSIGGLEYIEDQFRKAKAMGLNSLRIHIKIGDPRYYLAADKVGLLIWTEMPNWQLLTDATKVRTTETFIGMAERDWNRPSIIIRSIINESWGVEMHNPEHRQWMSDTYDWLKALDPSRLVVDNSACYGNFHVVSDIDDMHVYYSVPDHYARFREWNDTFASRPTWSYAPQLNSAEERLKFMQDHWHSHEWITNAPEIRRRGDEPLILSEFGNWGLPDVEKLKAHYGGKEPWWFETGMQHGSGEVYPHGIEDRFALYHLNRAFPTLQALSKASQDMEFVALKWELEEMRRHAALQGYVITEFTDLHWECNGLLDMARNPKTFYKAIADINADDVILPKANRVAYWEGERVEVVLDVSKYSSEELANSRIVWSVEGTKLQGTVTGISPKQADVIRAGVIAFDAPKTAKSGKHKLQLQLFTSIGKEAARNHLDLYFFPRASAKPAIQARIFAPGFADGLRQLGYNLVDAMAEADVVITGHLTEDLRNYLLDGGKVLWLAETDDAQQSHWGGYYGVHVGPRKGTVWSGDWASNMNWLCQDKLFKDIPTEGLVDFAFADLTPEHVIHGIHPYYFENEVHSGLFLGWIHKAVALIAERTVGRGKLLISTYRLCDHLSSHPVAAILVRDMLARLAE
jgi:Glycosyl hydrolases family 2, sugar binding domain/Glycosyl hydrolases family 2/Glycosyl hydrolases family 2, TIM barrel domain